MRIYEDEDIFVEQEAAEVPWVKIFTKVPYKELTEVPDELRAKLWIAYETVERRMISFFRPDKINMASFGNYVPRVHIHVMARFKEDSFFPEPMWGTKQRDSHVEFGDFEEFAKELRADLRKLFKESERG